MKKQAASPTKRRLSDLERHLTSSDDKHGIAAGTASVLASARGKWHGTYPCLLHCLFWRKIAPVVKCILSLKIFLAASLFHIEFVPTIFDGKPPLLNIVKDV